MIRRNNIVGFIVYFLLSVLLIIIIKDVFTEGFSDSILFEILLLTVFFVGFTGLRYYIYSQVYDIEDTGDRIIFTSARGNIRYVNKRDINEIHYLLQSIEIKLVQGEVITILKSIVKKENGVPKYKTFLCKENLPGVRFFKA